MVSVFPGGVPVRDVESPLAPGLAPPSRLVAPSLLPGAASRLHLSSAAPVKPSHFVIALVCDFEDPASVCAIAVVENARHKAVATSEVLITSRSVGKRTPWSAKLNGSHDAIISERLLRLVMRSNMID